MKGTPEVRFAAHLSIDPDTQAKLKASQAKLSAELGRSATVLDVFKTSVELFLQMENDGQAAGWTHVPSTLYRVHLYPPPRDDGGCDCGHDDGESDDSGHDDGADGDGNEKPVREGPLWVETGEGVVPLDGNRTGLAEAKPRTL